MCSRINMSVIYTNSISEWIESVFHNKYENLLYIYAFDLKYVHTLSRNGTL